MTSDNTKKLYRAASIGHTLGFGQRPALIVVDMQYGFTDPARSPLAADVSREIPYMNALVDAMRARNAPIFWSVIAYRDSEVRDARLWSRKAPTLGVLVENTPMAEIDARMHFSPEDFLIVKKHASAFFGTPLASMLTASIVDTTVVIGCTTSGCVRATVTDAIAHGFRPIVPEEAVADRAPEPHLASLFDMGAKYADVMSVEETLQAIRACLDPRSGSG